MPRKAHIVSVLALIAAIFSACALIASCDGGDKSPSPPATASPSSPQKGGNPDGAKPPADPTSGGTFPPDAPPKIPQSLLKLLDDAEKCFNSGRYDEAADLAGKFLEQAGPDGRVYLLRGASRLMRAEQAAAERGDALLDAALEDLNKSVELLRDADPRPFIFRGVALLLAGRPGDAEADFRHLSQRFASLADGPFQLGCLALWKGDAAAARGHFDEALKREPRFQAALVERASILMERGEFDAADADLKALDALRPDSADGAYLMAHFCILRGQSLIESALLASPEAGQKLADEGVALLKDSVKRLDDLANGKAIPTAFLFLANVEAFASASSPSEQYYARSRETLLKMLDDAAGLPPAVLPRVYRDLGITYAAEGKSVEALEYFERAVACEASLKEIAADSRVLTIDKLLARRAIADSMRNAAMIQIKFCDDYEAAEKFLRRYLAFRPDAPDKEEMQSRLYDCELVRISTENGGRHTFEDCLRYLKHPYYKIRLAGLASLGKSDDPRCDEAIIGRLKDERAEVQRFTIKLIKERRLISAATEVAALVQHADAGVAIDAAACLAALKAEAAIPALIDALADERASIRESAIGALVDITARTMWYHFDDPPEKRDEAIQRWRQWWKERSGG